MTQLNTPGTNDFRGIESSADAVPDPVLDPKTPANDPMLALSIKNLSKVYSPSPRWLRLLLKTAITAPVVALEDISFELARGEICVIVGPNGAGKSTLFRILTGLTTATSGSATVLGHDVNDGVQIRSLIGFMPAEDRNLMLRHTCAQNLEFRGRLQGLARTELPGRIDEVLEQVGIPHAKNQAAISLSTGMRARLQLAAALLHSPELLILDEPTAAVDPVGAHELLELIDGLTRQRQLSVVLSSHRLEEIDALRNKVVFLDGGRVIHDGNLGELRKIWEIPRYRIGFTADTDVEAIHQKLARLGFDQIEVEGSAIEITTKRSVGELLALLGPDAERIESFDRVTMALRELFHKLLSGEIRGLT